MKENSIAFNRAYVKGLNTITPCTMGSLSTLKTGLLRLLKNPTLPKHQVESLIQATGEIERLNAPKEIWKKRTNSESWIGSACCDRGEQWEQWIQTIRIPRSRVIVETQEKETIEEQTIMVGSDRKRIHIEWGSGRQEGYIHSSTSRYMKPEDFLETSPAPPNCLMALPAGSMAMDGWTIQTGNLYNGVDDSFRWYDDDLTRRWYRILEYNLGGTTYVCMLDAKHLRDALSGMDDNHAVTICEKTEGEVDEGLHILKGSIRIDGSYNGKQRTAVLMTARINDDRIQKLMGVYNSNN